MRSHRSVSFRNAVPLVLLGGLPWVALHLACSSSEGDATRGELPPPFPGSSVLPNSPGGASSASAGASNPAGAPGQAGAEGNGGAPALGTGLGAGGAGSAAGARASAAAGAAVTAGVAMYAPSGPLSALCPAGTAFCEDFEDDTLDRAPQAPWQDAANGATVRVNATRAFSGSQALLVNVPSGPSPHRGYVALQQGSFAAANREMYGRVMVFLEATPTVAPGQSGLHWTLFQGEGRAATNNYNAIYRFGGELQGGAGLMANYETTQDGNPPVRSDCAQHSQTRMPVQRWACFEWHFSQATNEVQYWLDGGELSDIHVVDRGPTCRYDEPPLNGQWLAPPVFQTLYMGWEQYAAASNPLNVWLDGIVVGTGRIGCPAPL
jgi:hypothetical protein